MEDHPLRCISSKPVTNTARIEQPIGRTGSAVPYSEIAPARLTRGSRCISVSVIWSEKTRES